MYAVLRTGGKQYRVTPGDVIRVEKLEQNLGSEVDLTDILLVGGEQTVVGQPVVQDAKVTVVVTMQAKNRKVLVFKKKRRQGYRRMKGHRQLFTELFIKSITLNGKTVAAETEARIRDPREAEVAEVDAQEGQTESKKTKVAKVKKTAKPAAKKKVAKKAAPKKSSTQKKVAKKTSKKA